MTKKPPWRLKKPSRQGGIISSAKDKGRQQRRGGERQWQKQASQRSHQRRADGHRDQFVMETRNALRACCVALMPRTARCARTASAPSCAHARMARYRTIRRFVSSATLRKNGFVLSTFARDAFSPAAHQHNNAAPAPRMRRVYLALFISRACGIARSQARIARLRIACAALQRVAAGEERQRSRNQAGWASKAAAAWRWTIFSSFLCSG